MLDALSEVALSGLLHLADDERANLTRRVLLAAGLEPCVAVGVLDDLKRDVVDVLLDLGVGPLATDETLGGVAERGERMGPRRVKGSRSIETGEARAAWIGRGWDGRVVVRAWKGKEKRKERESVTRTSGARAAQERCAQGVLVVNDSCNTADSQRLASAIISPTGTHPDAWPGVRRDARRPW